MSETAPLMSCVEGKTWKRSLYSVVCSLKLDLLTSLRSWCKEGELIQAFKTELQNTENIFLVYFENVVYVMS